MTNTHDEWLWTDWAGGECPLEDTERIWKYRVRSGRETTTNYEPRFYGWRHSNSSGDITAYAVQNPNYVAPATTDHFALLRQCGKALVGMVGVPLRYVDSTIVIETGSHGDGIGRVCKARAAIEALRKAGVM